MGVRTRTISCRRKDAWYVFIIVLICTVPYLSIRFLIPSITNQESRTTTPLEHFGVDQAHVFICAEEKKGNSRLIDCPSHAYQHEPWVVGSLDIVIAHYQHSLVGLFRSVLATTSRSARPLRIWVYSKGTLSHEDQDLLKGIVSSFKGVTVFFQLNMKNVGRCDHTYLHHIGQHYHDLANFTVFLKDTTPWHLHLDEMSNTLSLLTFRVPRELQVWCPRELIVERTSFQLKRYKSEQCSRFGRCYSNETYIRSSIVPLGNWMNKMKVLSSAHQGLSNGMEGGGDDVGLRGWKVRVVPVCYGGIFGATSTAIRHSSKSSYSLLEKELSIGDSIEVGHYMERSWFSTFGVWAVGTIEYRNRLAVLVVGDIPACALRTPLRFADSDVLVSFFLVSQSSVVEHSRDNSSHAMNASSSIGAHALLQKGNGWNLLKVTNEDAIYTPHRIKELSSFDYTLAFFSNGDSKHPVALSSGLQKEFSVCTMTAADVRVGIGRSLVNGSTVALPRHAHNLNFELGVVLRRMTESAQDFGNDWLQAATSQATTAPLEALEWARSRHPVERVGPLMVEGGLVTTHDHTTFWGPLSTRKKRKL